MEAKEAPEKIYIPTILAANTVRYKEKGSIEYVRTDAFIKKAEKWLKEHALDYAHELICGVGKTQSDYYTRHFVEDFKIYMKGE